MVDISLYTAEYLSKPATLELMKKARRWLHWRAKSGRKVPYYANGKKRSGTLDSPDDVAQLVTYAEAKAALEGKHKETRLGFALGRDEDTALYWQGADFDGSKEGIEKAQGYVEISPSGNGYHAIGHGQHFTAYHKDGIELYCEKRFFTFTGDNVNDGPLVDLTDTGLRKFLKATKDDNREQYCNGQDHTSADTGTTANPLQAYIDAGEIPAGECDNVLTQFWGHAARAVKQGHATVEQAALFMGRVNVRLAENKDKDFNGKLRRMLEKEGLPLPIDVGKYASFDDGNPIQLLGPKPTKLPPLIYKSDFDFAELQIPLRDWVLKGLLLRKHLTILVAPPGTGKSLISLQLAIAMAVGKRWSDWVPERRTKTLVLNTEDDREEMDRRIIAACKHMGVNRRELNGWLHVVDMNDRQMIMVSRDPKTKEITETGFSSLVVEICRKEGIDAVVIDPLVETHNLNENDQTDAKSVAVVLRNLARDAEVAAFAIHHTPKGAANMAGNADAGRGATAFQGVARIMATLFPMTEKEAGDLSIELEERRDYMRLDGAKANYSKLATKTWLRKQEVWLDNGPDGTPGDAVGVLEPWGGYTDEDVAEREDAVANRKKDKLLKAFNDMLFDGARVLRVGRGANHIQVPEGCTDFAIRDLLAKIKVSNKQEEWAKKCLLDNYAHQEYPGSNDTTVAIVFTALEFKTTEGSLALKVGPKE